MRDNNNFFIRINGIAHAFCRQLGCDCNRCTTINYNMTVPQRMLCPFTGWPDPPWRAQTSVSLLIPDPSCPNRIGKHILVDVGCGVPESLAASAIPGIENIHAVLLTHWHPDHVIGENQLGESVKRANSSLSPIPLYCHADTFSEVSARFPYDMKHSYRHVSISDGVPFSLGPFEFTPFLVRHLNFNGCVVFVCTEKTTRKKLVFAWDVDTPDCTFPRTSHTNLDVFRNPKFANADLMILETNTWQVSSFTRGGELRRTGHTSFLEGWEYVDICKPKALGVIHLSGHEDKHASDKKGFGWIDRTWIDEVRKHVNTQGAGIRVHELFQGTVLASNDL